MYLGNFKYLNTIVISLQGGDGVMKIQAKSQIYSECGEEPVRSFT